MSEFEAFLQRQESGFLDSTGAFTISPQKAMEKLARFQLPNPAFWILKVVQSAVVSQATHISVSLDRWVIRISFDPIDEISMSEVQRAFSTLEPNVERSAELLGAGLRAVGVKAERKFAVRLQGNSGTDTLLWDGSDLALRHEEGSKSPSSVDLEVSSMPSSQWGRVTDALRIPKAIEERAVLQTRAHTLAISLSLDGQEMLEPPSSEDKPFCQPLARDYLLGEGQGLAVPSWFVRQRGQCMNLSASPPPERVPMMWTLDYHYKIHHAANRLTPEPESENVPSTLSWVSDGVIVEMERLETKSIPFQFKFFVSAQDCVTDIGGFRLRRDERYETIRNQVQIERLKALRDLSALIQESEELPGPRLTGLKALTTSIKYLPVMENLTYDAQTTVSKKLAALPRFRMALRQKVLADAKRFSR